MLIPVILAGGSGTRLWPLSRELNPKQLLSLTDDHNHTMLQQTVLRASKIKNVAPPLIICNEEHRFMTAEQLRATNLNPAAIILEPQGRNTAPAIAIAALRALATSEDPVLLILPADHTIDNQDAFEVAVQAGYQYSLQDYLILFGIVPSTPETGYGYIHKAEALPQLPQAETQGFAIKAFVEKPDAKTAEDYVASGQFYWNSGIFMFKASQILAELRRLVPDIVTACEKSLQEGSEDLDFFRLDPSSFAECHSDSIDYAVMEKTSKSIMIPLRAEWNDLGSWEALWQVCAKDANHNVIKGDVLTHDVKNSYIHADKRLVAAVGLTDHIVVETSDAVLIAPRCCVQDVKQLVSKLNQNQREEALSHKKVYRPWGSYESIDASSRFQVKRITVNPGGTLSLQKHFHRSEHWTIVAGTALVTKGDKEFILKEDESTYIPLGTQHRLKNPGKIPLELIEVQTGGYLGEDDIVRFDDDYGR